ncbi:MAG: HEAT repeat domain-containing protein [Acidobacteria bacterium]|nr:HEAT repeat domain-containing protein [Acidobacteriota bacterium]
MRAPQRRAGVMRALNDVETLRRLLRLYPGGHPSLRTAEERIRASAGALLEEGCPLTLALGPDKVFVETEEISLPATAPACRVVRLLFHLGLAGLRLEGPRAVDGLVTLGRRLAALREPPTEADRQALLGAADVLEDVTLVPIDLSHIQFVDDESAERVEGARGIWQELAARLSRSGVFPFPGQLELGELTAGALADLHDQAGGPESLFDHLFTQLAEMLQERGAAHRPVPPAQIRAFLDELIRLLDPERRPLAVLIASRHLTLVEEGESASPAFVSAELILDAVELMLLRWLEVPPSIERAVRRLATTEAGAEPVFTPELISRAKALAGQLDRRAPPPRVPRPEPVRRDVSWIEAPWRQELEESLAENPIRLHLVKVLSEAASFWPDEPIAERSTVRLADEFLASLEIGDLETAALLAPLMASTRSPEARRIAYEGGAAAAAAALRNSDAEQEATIVAILTTLGALALPALLEAVAGEESADVRRRLLEIVLSHGERAIPLVRPLLDDARWYVVRNAVFLLRRLDDRGIAPLLKTRLATARPQVVEEILKVLVSLEDPEWLPLLLREIDGDDPDRQTVALDVAARITHPAVVDGLVERLQQRLGVRLREPTTTALIRALGRLGDPAALPVLQKILDAKQWRIPFNIDTVRVEAARAVAQLPGADAGRLAASLTKDRDPRISAVAKRALRGSRAGQRTEG